MSKEKLDIIEALKKRGYTYVLLKWNDGSPMTHRFIQKDTLDPDCEWVVSIEDHRGEGPVVDDFVIYSEFHDPEEKDWYGHQINTQGAVEYEAMKLIVKFIDILKEEEK